MPNATIAPRPLVIDRIARVAFTFLVMNCSAVIGLLLAIRRRPVWR